MLDAGVHGYYAGGAGDERTLRDNVDAFGRWSLRPRVLVDVARTSAATTVLGSEVSMPLLVAPTALQRLAHPDGEPGMARAAAAAGTIFTLSTLATSRPTEVAEEARRRRAGSSSTSCATAASARRSWTRRSSAASTRSC